MYVLRYYATNMRWIAEEAQALMNSEEAHGPHKRRCYFYNCAIFILNYSGGGSARLSRVLLDSTISDTETVEVCHILSTPSSSGDLVNTVLTS